MQVVFAQLPCFGLVTPTHLNVHHFAIFLPFSALYCKDLGRSAKAVCKSVVKLLGILTLLKFASSAK